MSNITCPVCGATQANGQRFCAECGSRLDMAQNMAEPADRNSVMHRPGGGKPDPFEVGSAESGFDDDDDFFSQFRPKSASAAADEHSFPSRRSRRRFNPNIYETGSIDSAQRENIGQVPPLFPSRGDAATEQPQQPPATAASEHSAPVTSPLGEQGEPLPPKTTEMSVAQLQEALGTQPEVRQDAQPAPSAPAEQSHPGNVEEPSPEGEAQPWSVDANRRRMVDEATFTQLIEGLPNDPADQPIESPRYVQEDARVLAHPQPELPAQPAAPEPQHQQALPEEQFAPLPQPEPDLHQAEQQQRADEFFGVGAQSDIATQQLPQPAPEQSELPPLPSLPPLPNQQPEHDDLDWIDQQFGGRSHEEQLARNQQEAPASQRDWRASDRRAAEQNVRIGAGTGAAPFAPVMPAPPLPAAGAGGSRGGEPPRFSTEEVQRRRRGVKVILLAAAAAVVLVLGAFGVKALLGGGEKDPVADGETQVAEQTETPTTSGSEPTEEPTPETFEPVTFQSGSGNIRCQITAEDGVACEITSVNFVVPADMCQSGQFSGAAVGVTTEGATYPCLTETLPGGMVLDYDVPVTAGQYTCSINYETGVTCDNGNGAGFTMEYSAGITIDGAMAQETHPEVTPAG